MNETRQTLKMVNILVTFLDSFTPFSSNAVDVAETINAIGFILYPGCRTDCTQCPAPSSFLSHSTTLSPHDLATAFLEMTDKMIAIDTVIEFTKTTMNYMISNKMATTCRRNSGK